VAEGSPSRPPALPLSFVSLQLFSAAVGGSLDGHFRGSLVGRTLAAHASGGGAVGRVGGGGRGYATVGSDDGRGGGMSGASTSGGVAAGIGGIGGGIGGGAGGLGLVPRATSGGGGSGGGGNGGHDKAFNIISHPDDDD